MEVVRDRADNCIIICSIENVDPMGVHTGDSITVAPALTLTDKEYQRMRNASIAVLREIGVDTGGSNVQFAIDPADGRMVVIEMNPRVSRSLGAGLQGHGLPDRQGRGQARRRLHAGRDPERHHRRDAGLVRADDRLRRHQDPALHLREVPRDRALADHLDEVGGRGDGDRPDLQGIAAEGAARRWRPACRGSTRSRSRASRADRPREAILAALARPTPDRLRVIAQAFREGLSVAEIHGACAYDPWFLAQIQELVAPRRRCAAKACRTMRGCLHALKADGFSDRAPGQAHRPGARRGARRGVALGRPPRLQAHRHLCRRVRGAHALYVQLLRDRHLSASPAASARAGLSDRRKVIILGGGPNRIGQGIEFDYCCVHAAFGLKEAGFETIMVNCNPETVSTDPDTSDRLYFEPLTAEDVLEICRVEASRGELLGRDRPARRPDAAQAQPCAGEGRRADPGHLARRHRPRRGPRALPATAAQAGPEAAGQRHLPRPGRRAREGRRAGLPAGDPALLRAGRAGDAHRPLGSTTCRASWPMRRAPPISGRS